MFWKRLFLLRVRMELSEVGVFIALNRVHVGSAQVVLQGASVSALKVPKME